MTRLEDRERLKGHLDLLLLSVLQRTPVHGYALVTQLCTASAGAFDLPEGTVYPALHRLERAGWVTSTWVRSAPAAGGRRRKVYAVTPSGHLALATERSRWERFSSGIRAVLHHHHPDPQAVSMAGPGPIPPTC
jgi:DNA-binding PadR family transcriptional regulator